jgi:hypothetical protein
MDSTIHSAVMATSYQRISIHILRQDSNDIQLRLRQEARLPSINSTGVFLPPPPQAPRIQRELVVALIVATASSGKRMMLRLDQCQRAPEGS